MDPFLPPATLTKTPCGPQRKVSIVRYVAQLLVLGGFSNAARLTYP